MFCIKMVFLTSGDIIPWESGWNLPKSWSFWRQCDKTSISEGKIHFVTLEMWLFFLQWPTYQPYISICIPAKTDHVRTLSDLSVKTFEKSLSCLQNAVNDILLAFRENILNKKYNVKVSENKGYFRHFFTCICIPSLVHYSRVPFLQIGS